MLKTRLSCPSSQYDVMATLLASNWGEAIWCQLQQIFTEFQSTTGSFNEWSEKWQKILWLADCSITMSPCSNPYQDNSSHSIAANYLPTILRKLQAQQYCSHNFWHQPLQGNQLKVMFQCQVWLYTPGERVILIGFIFVQWWLGSLDRFVIALETLYKVLVGAGW